MKLTIEQIAKCCHQVNKAYCESISDFTQDEWEEAPMWQRDSAIAGVKAHIDSDFTMTPEGSHESWMAQKKLEGWKYGPVKNADLKEHPCMVPYDQLPNRQRAKDHLFRQVVHVLARFN